ncbi:MAG: hypothetical protein ACTSU2_00790 [Promethearchaeota archaeon]
MINTQLPKYFERNVQFIKERMEKQIKDSLSRGNSYIDRELQNPLFFLIRPAIKAFYNNITKPQLERGSKNNLKLCLEVAKEKIINPEIDLDELIDKYFNQYLKGDQTASALNKKHPNYPWFVENTRRIFKAQIIPLIKMLKCEEPASNYDELSVKTFKTPEIARKTLSEQLDLMYDGIKKIESDMSILNLPVGRDILINVLKKGFQDTRKELIGDIDVIFNKYGDVN